MTEFKLYRAVVPKNKGKEEFCKYRETMRPPGNVPYLVDNLWEWLRPESYPCRRLSSYASPTPELALESGRKGSTVFELKFSGALKLAQLKSHADSKYHPESSSTASEVISLLGKSTNTWWPNLTRKTKLKTGQLWMPCLTKNEVDELFAIVPELQAIRSEVISKVRYWEDVEPLDLQTSHLPDEKGEIFFEAKDGYWLVPIS